MPRGPEPLDQKTIAILRASADEFEKAIVSGRVFNIAVASQRLLENVKRFLPTAFSRSSSPAGASDRSTFRFPPSRAHDWNPDPAYLETARASIREFKESISAGDMERSVEALRPTGIMAVPSPREELERLELEVARAPGMRRLLFLPRIAKLALWAGDADKAERSASEVLRLTVGPRGKSLDSEEAIHDGNMVLGLLALRRGDRDAAKKHLLASARTEGSFEMRVSGPNLSLAGELLGVGEREVVIEYLEACKAFWSVGGGLLEKWIERIRRGQDPEFDTIYFSS